MMILGIEYIELISFKMLYIHFQKVIHLQYPVTNPGSTYLSFLLLNKPSKHKTLTKNQLDQHHRW